MPKVLFYYEKDFSGKWVPKIYYDGPMPKKTIEEFERSPVVELPDIHLYENGQLLTPIETLVELYPAPKV